MPVIIILSIMFQRDIFYVQVLGGLLILISFSFIILAFLLINLRLFSLVAFQCFVQLIYQICPGWQSIQNILFDIIEIRMYIEPAEYLELTDRLAILTKKYQTQTSQKTDLYNKTVSLAQKVRLLESRISQLQKQKLEQKMHLKQHVTNKTNNILTHISTSKQNQRNFVEEQISKLRNWSAIQTLNKLEERIAENRTVTFEKQFYEKVKTLYIIKKKKVGCTHTELFEWVRDIAELKKGNQADGSLNVTQKSTKGITQSQRNRNPTTQPQSNPKPTQISIKPQKPKQQVLDKNKQQQDKMSEILDQDVLDGV